MRHLKAEVRAFGARGCGIAVFLGIVIWGASGAAGRQVCDRWQVVAPEVGPSARNSHAMAFDSLRGRVVLHGGTDGSFNDETWARSGDQWGLLAKGGPSARIGHQMVYDHSRDTLVLFGGFRDQGNVRLGDTWEYGPSGTWSLVANTGPAPRSYHAMVYDSTRGVTVLFGGWDQSSRRLGDTWEWDGAQWRLVAETGPSGRGFHAMAYDSRRGVTVLFGGYLNLSDTWEWDGASWNLVSEDGPPGRWSHSMAFDNDRGVTVLYGKTETDQRTWEWDGETWRSVSVAGPEDLGGARMVYDNIRRATVFYGATAGKHVWEWNGANWSRLRAVGPPPRQGHGLAFDQHRGVTLMFGGWSGARHLGDTWEWDGHEWKLVSESGPENRVGVAMAYDSRRRVVVLFGGFAGTQRRGDTWEWDGVQWTLVPIQGPAPDSWDQMVFDEQRGVCVLFRSTGLRETWEYSGAAWTMVATGGPHERGGAAMAYDAQRGVTVLTGGVFYDYRSEEYWWFKDIWEWNGSRWRRVAVDDRVQRDAHSMAYDPVRREVLIYGGYNGDTGANYRDIWGWDGATLELINGAGPYRSLSEMAFDTDRSELVMFGGLEDSSRRPADTWTLAHRVTPELFRVTSCPESGPATLGWACCSRDGRVGIIFARETGVFRVPSGQPCTGQLLGLGPRGITLLGVVQSDFNGSGEIRGILSSNACGGYLQIIDAQTCSTSPVVRID